MPGLDLWLSEAAIKPHLKFSGFSDEKSVIARPYCTEVSGLWLKAGRKQSLHWPESNQSSGVYGFDARGDKDFTDIKWEGNNILLFGSEGFGMRQHTGKDADFFVKIDINEEIESLNISNSAAIVFHHLSYLKKKSWLFNK